MRYAARALLLLAVFAVVAVFTAHLVITHAANAGTAEPEIRLAGYMGGLFAGGAAVVLVGIALALGNRK